MQPKQITTAILSITSLFFVQLASAQRNGVEDDVIKVAGITTDAQIYPLTPVQKQTTITYYDGMGRPIQNVVQYGSPTQNDIVQPIVYDSVGRQSVSYLPYSDPANSSITPGNYRTNALTAQKAFYDNTAQSLVAVDTGAYSQQVFENSPLQRLLQWGMVGGGFQPLTGQHYKHVSYRPNNSSDGGILMWINNQVPTGAIYANNTLSVTDGFDEDSTETLTFTDITGHLVLKRQMLGTTKMDTYYLYNNAGMVSYVIPPLATQNLAANSYNLTATQLVNLIFRFTYDNRGRLIQKQVPAKGSMNMVYDPLNRPVLTQDANRAASHQWSYIKYDAKGRAVSSGIYYDAGHTSQAAMQAHLDSMATAYNTAWYEGRDTTRATGYYTNNIFPTTNITPLNYAYFDNYDLNQDGNPDFTYLAPGLPGQETPTTDSLKGVPTITRQRSVGETAVTWLVKVIFYDHYGHPIQTQSNNQVSYAKFGETIVDHSSVVPDFMGVPQVTKVIKSVHSVNTTVRTNFTYDQMDRVIAITQQYNSLATVPVVNYTYNEIGQLVSKGLGQVVTGTIPTDLTLNTAYTGTNSFAASNSITLAPGFAADSGSTFRAFISTGYLQSVDLRYNIRAQLTSINSSQLTGTYAGSLFGMQLLYNQQDTNIGAHGNQPYYNGMLSAVKWMSKDSLGNNSNERSYYYNYDKQNRYIAATYGERTGATGSFSTNAHAYDEFNVSYDLNGNIGTLKRNAPVNSAVTLIDSLTYGYQTNSLNVLNNVSDATGDTRGFNNATGTTTGNYTYDVNGNLLTDPYKGLTISYNILNKTNTIKITATPADSVKYIYAADGTVLRKLQYTGTKYVRTTYIDGFVFQGSGTGDTISYFATPEGRVLRSNGGATLTQVYVITDQQGNARISFMKGPDGYAKIIQEDSYYGFGMVMANSDVPTPANPNKNLYNGGSEWQNDYGNLLNYYQAGARNYDPATGRFVGVDPMAESAESMTGYNYAGNNPIVFNDPLGDKPGIPSTPQGMPAPPPRNPNNLHPHARPWHDQQNGDWLESPYADQAPGWETSDIYGDIANINNDFDVSTFDPIRAATAQEYGTSIYNANSSSAVNGQTIYQALSNYHGLILNFGSNGQFGYATAQQGGVQGITADVNGAAVDQEELLKLGIQNGFTLTGNNAEGVDTQGLFESGIGIAGGLFEIAVGLGGEVFTGGFSTILVADGLARVIGNTGRAAAYLSGNKARGDAIPSNAGAMLGAIIDNGSTSSIGPAQASLGLANDVLLMISPAGDAGAMQDLIENPSVISTFGVISSYSGAIIGVKDQGQIIMNNPNNGN